MRSERLEAASANHPAHSAGGQGQPTRDRARHRHRPQDDQTIRSYQRKFTEGAANSPGVATDPEGELPPPRPPTTATATVATSASACEPHRAFIEAQWCLRRNATAIYQDLVDQHVIGSSA
jgi:hypothetical protein